MTPNQAAVVKKVNELIAVANEKFGTTCPVPAIKFDLKGTCAGQAIRRAKRNGEREFILRFNNTLLEANTESMIGNTVPHEVAHTICQFNPNLGHGHNSGWKRVCKALGGDAERTHDMPVVYARGKTYEYVTTAGKTVILSEHYHKALASGRKLIARNAGEITIECQHRVIGINGKFVADLPAAPKMTSSDSAAPAKKAASSTKSKADQVRELIAAAKTINKSIDDVILQVIAELGMARGQARTYVKNNWEKVAV